MGANLKRFRLAAALSQEELALAAGINRSYLSSVERGHRNVSIDNICRIAAALDRHPRELLSAPPSVVGPAAATPNLYKTPGAATR